MVAKIGAAVLVAGLAFAGPAAAQGFSEGGVAGVAALRGTTASPGYGTGASGLRGGPAAGAVDGPVALAPESVPRHRRRLTPTDVDFAPRPGPSEGLGLPF